MVKYLNYSQLISLCDKGETEEIKESITFYEEKKNEVSDKMVLVGEVINILGIEDEVKDIKKFIGVKEITPQSLIALCHKKDISNDARIQYEKYNKLEKTYEWYEFVVENLKKALE